MLHCPVTISIPELFRLYLLINIHSFVVFLEEEVAVCLFRVGLHVVRVNLQCSIETVSRSNELHKLNVDGSHIGEVLGDVGVSSSGLLVLFQ